MKRFILGLVLAWLILASPVHAQQAAVGAVHSHTSAATLTIAAPPTNQFVYITGIDISNCAGATAVTAAAPTYITTTNLTGAPQYQLGSGITAGLCQPTSSGIDFVSPLRSTTAATAVTFVLPTFATNQVVSVNVYYFYGNAR
jgi:hypothetical protein